MEDINAKETAAVLVEARDAAAAGAIATTRAGGDAPGDSTHPASGTTATAAGSEETKAVPEMVRVEVPGVGPATAVKAGERSSKADAAAAAAAGVHTMERKAAELTVRYSWAIVMANSVPSDVDAEPLRVMHRKLVESLLRLDLEVLLLIPTSLTRDKFVILVSSESQDDELLSREEKLVHSNRYLQFGLILQPQDDELQQAQADAAHAEREMDEQHVSIGGPSTAATERHKSGKVKMSSATKVYLTYQIVERALKMATESPSYKAAQAQLDAAIAASVVDDDARVGNGVLESFPLHDEKFNSDMMERLTSKRRIGTCRRFLDVSHLMLDMRQQFGSRVAFYFAYVNYYTRWLYPLTLYALFFYVIARPIDWGAYSRGLSLLGFMTPALWAPLFIKYWRRHSNSLAFKWKLLDVPEGAHENPFLKAPRWGNRKQDPEASWNWVQNKDTRELEKVMSKAGRHKVHRMALPFAIVNLLFLVLVATPFVQWYVYGKLAPTCDCCSWFLDLGDNATTLARSGRLMDFAHEDGVTGCDAYIVSAGNTGYKPPASCRYFISCFNSGSSTVGTDRWLYILVQGIILGIVLDVVQFEAFVSFTTWLTKLENWPTEAEFERRLIRKQFLFMWVNMYFWFLFIAFVYVPFGDILQDLLIEFGFSFAVPGHGWRAGVINIDEAFVTPLVVTQAINLTLETFIPLLVNKSKQKQAVLARDARAAMGNLRKGTKMTAKKMFEPLSFDFDVAGLAQRIRRGTLMSADSVPNLRERKGTVESAAAPSIDEDAASEGDVGRGAEEASAGDEGASAAAATPAKRAGAALGGEAGGDVTPAQSSTSGGDAVARGTPDHSPETTAARLAASGVAGELGITIDDGGDGRGGGAAAGAGAGGGREPSFVHRMSKAELRKSVVVIEVPAAPHVGPMSARGRGPRASMSGAADEDVRFAHDEFALDGLKQDMLVLWANMVGSSHSPVIEWAHTSGDSNDYDANEVVMQSERPEFHPRVEYLDMMMQFGYVTMFTTAWALAPVAAVINNVFELRGDAFKLMYGMRRPVPKDDKDMGEWHSMLWLAAQMSVAVSAGLIVMGTGQAEHWMEGLCENVAERDERSRSDDFEPIMGPDLECFPSWGIRLAVALFLEHLGLFMIFVVSHYVSDRTRKLKAALHVRDVRLARTLQDRMLPDIERSFAFDLRIVFDYYAHPEAHSHTRTTIDARQLSRSECNVMLKDLHKLQPLVKAKPSDATAAGAGAGAGAAAAAPELTADDLNELFDFIDADDTETVTYAECALALKRAQMDPLMFRVFGVRFKKAVAARAAQLRATKKRQ